MLIIYDICDNKQRHKLAKFLQGYGQRIQRSAFEAYLQENEYNRMISGIRKYATDEDNIRIYKLHQGMPILNLGKDVKVYNDDVIII